VSSALENRRIRQALDAVSSALEEVVAFVKHWTP